MVEDILRAIRELPPATEPLTIAVSLSPNKPANPERFQCDGEVFLLVNRADMLRVERDAMRSNGKAEEPNLLRTFAPSLSGVPIVDLGDGSDRARYITDKIRRAIVYGPNSSPSR